MPSTAQRFDQKHGLEENRRLIRRTADSLCKLCRKRHHALPFVWQDRLIRQLW
jgi:hypothetical protein